MNAHKFEIRKLSLGENLDEAFKLFRHGFWRFLFFQLLIYGPSITVFSLAVHSAGNAIFRMLETGELPKAGDFLIPISLVSGAMLFIHGIVGPISTVALTRGVADTYLGKPFTVGSILRDAISRAPGAIGVGLGVIIVAAIGYVLPPLLFAGSIFVALKDSIFGGDFAAIAMLIGASGLGGALGLAAGTYLVLRYSVALTVVAVERTDFSASFRRSAQLMRKKYWGALALFLIQIAFNALAGLLLSALVPSPSFEGIDPEELKALVPELVRSQILSSILGQVSGMIVGTYTIICWTLFYFTLRCEKEGFDLSYLAEKVARGE